jgi:hypothetical protein
MPKYFYSIRARFVGLVLVGAAVPAASLWGQEAPAAPSSVVVTQEVRTQADTTEVIRVTRNVLDDERKRILFLEPDPVGNFPKMEPARLRTLNANGFFRQFLTYRHLPGNYAYLPTSQMLPREFFVGDDSQLPTLMVNITGKTRPGATFGMDLYAFQFLDNPGRPAYGVTGDLGGHLLLNLGMNVYATLPTAWGPLSVKLGGIHWEEMTDLTMGAYTGYNRYMLFDRNPWDPIGTTPFARYQRYIEAGSVNQEMRWGKRAFVGGVVDWVGLPHGQKIKVLVGKNEQNGGFDRRPNGAWGGQYSIPVGRSRAWVFSAQSMQQRSYQDTLLTRPFGSGAATGKLAAVSGRWTASAEAGYGYYFSEDNGQSGGLVAQLRAARSMGKRFQMLLHAYAVHPGAVNNASAVVNGSVQEAAVNQIPAGQAGSQAVLNPVGPSLLGFAQLANNRFGADLNAVYKAKHVYLTGGYSATRQWEAGGTTFAFGHPVNALTRSRFYRWGFPQAVGPYGRTNVLYRSTYELLDFKVPVDQPLHFSQWEAQALYSIPVGNHQIAFNHLVRAHSVQQQPSLLYVRPDAVLRQYSSENEIYWKTSDRWTWVGCASADATLGSLKTNSNATGRPIDQRGWALGWGFDCWAADNAQIFFRSKAFGFADRSFELDAFRGTETTVELKLFF